MIHHLSGILAADELAELRARLADAPWSDGRITAGPQAALAKRNQQLAGDLPLAVALRERVLAALERSADFAAAALPLRIHPPFFNRYGIGMGFGDHIDNAIRSHRGVVLRTDLSATLFLSAPEEYDGGDLVVDDGGGGLRARLPAGDLLLYPAGRVHRVEPVTRGARLACVFWVQSLVRDEARRDLVHDLDRSLGLLRRRGLEGSPELVLLTGIWNNLLKQWAET